MNLYAGFGWDPVNRRDPTGMLPPDLPPLLELGTEGRAAQQECQLGIGEGAWGTIVGIAKGLYSLKDPTDVVGALGDNAQAAAIAAYKKEGGGFSGALYGAVAAAGSILPDIGGSYHRATIAGDPRTRCREATTMMIGGAEVAAGAYGALSVGRGIARSGAAVGRTPRTGAPLAGEAGALSIADDLAGSLSGPVGENVVFRALRADELELLAECGLISKNPRATMTPLDHVVDGSNPGFASQYISTTRSSRFAERWARKSRTGYVKIDLTRAGSPYLDLSTSSGRTIHLGDASAAPLGSRLHDGNRFARGAQEVLVAGPIPPEAIIEVVTF